MSQFTNIEKATEAERETKMRLDVYSRSAGDKGLAPIQKRRIEIMREIAAEYRQRAEDEALF
jgi:hypothetical protein